MSMRPSGLVKVLNEIVINRRSCIVECGGGVSTFYIARLLKEKGGHLYTIEHDKEWVEVLQGLLAEQGLDKFVSVIFAPLVKTQLAVNAGSWYNESIIQKALATIKLDLLIVDGPPAYQKSLSQARYPAVPYFKEFFSEDYAIVLDDINRKGEQEILLKWENQLGICFERYLIDGSVAIGRAKKSFKIS